MNWLAATRRDWLPAGLFLAALLFITFSPAVFGGRTLLLASWDAPSVMDTGAYDPESRTAIRLQRTSDPGASAWQTEAWYKLIADVFWIEHSLPLWNPYNAYGTPLSASALSQPFFPLTLLLSIHVTPSTYNFLIIGRLLLGAMLMYAFARQFLTALPSLFAAVTFMLSGYFIIYLNIAHLSVEVLTPGLFLAFELLLRKNSWAAVAGMAAMILLGMTGGMPESLFLIVAFACLYFVCRLLSAAEFRAKAIALSIKFVASIILGFGLSGFLLLPFLEFLPLSHDVHQPSNIGGIQGGLLHDGNYYLTIQYLLPLILGPVLNSILSGFAGWSGLRGYWGILPFYFWLLALLVLFFPSRSPRADLERFLTIFFTTTLVLMVLKRFGHSSINWIGRLPLSEMVLYPKYLEPLMALCIAMLGGLGLAALIDRRATVRHVLAATIVVLSIMLFLAGSLLGDVRAFATKVTSFQGMAAKVSLFFYLSIACGVTLLIVIAVVAWFTQRASDSIRPRLLYGAVVLLCLELLFNFIVPSFYLLSSLAPLKADPYKGAPYIEFIRAQNKDHSRIFARHNFLFPNWSSAFGLADVRNLDAMQFKRYRTFIRGFLLPADAAGRINGDLADRFTGGEFPYEFNTDLERRYLALSSIKYLISDTDYGRSSKLPDEIVFKDTASFATPFKKIYDSEVRVFEVPNLLSRASLFRSIEILPDQDVLARLKDPAFNPYEKAIVSRETLAAANTGDAQRLVEATAAPFAAARISAYQSQYVSIEADTATPTLLVLNDANFPGWRVYVNGQPATMVTANYLFRGVLLPSGKSTVEFKYQPRSFQYGAAMSLSACVTLAGLMIRERRRRRATMPTIAGYSAR
jgi:Bacterial membrane protein YfhO